MDSLDSHSMVLVQSEDLKLNWVTNWTATLRIWEKYIYITKTRPCNIRKKFGCKNEKFRWKKKILIFAKTIDCGYTLEPPRRGGFNEYPQSMFQSKNNGQIHSSYMGTTCLIMSVGNHIVHFKRTAC